MDFEIEGKYLIDAVELSHRSVRSKPKKNYVSNHDESLRLFHNRYLEKLSKVHPATPLVIFVPVIAYLAWRSIVVFHVSVLAALALFASGILFWTLFEYLLHRFVFHFEPKQPGLLKELQFLFHGIHHAYPKDSRRLVMPLAILIYFATARLLPERLVPSFFAGFVFGYLCYDMMHFAIHHLAFSNKTWQKIRKHHYLHHYNNKEAGFGVSSPLWDYILRT